MSLSVKQLKEFLNDYPDYCEVILANGDPIKHIGTCITGNGTKVILAHSKSDRFDYDKI